MQQSPVILDLCLRKIQSGKSHKYCDTMVFEKLCFKMFYVHMKTKSQHASEYM